VVNIVDIFHLRVWTDFCVPNYIVQQRVIVYWIKNLYNPVVNLRVYSSLIFFLRIRLNF
jgi:hypothetical protein